MLNHRCDSVTVNTHFLLKETDIAHVHLFKYSAILYSSSAGAPHKRKFNRLRFTSEEREEISGGGGGGPVFKG